MQGRSRWSIENGLRVGVACGLAKRSFQHSALGAGGVLGEGLGGGGGRRRLAAERAPETTTSVSPGRTRPRMRRAMSSMCSSDFR